MCDYSPVISGHRLPGSVEVRAGAEYFLHPAGASQRRYEALRAYFTKDMPASEVADRFGYSTASVHQMATLLRAGKMSLFTDPRPGPKGPRKATGELRARVLALRAAGHSVTEIAAALTAQGLPVSAQMAWQILDAEGIPRLPRRDECRRGPPARLDAVPAATPTPNFWPCSPRRCARWGWPPAKTGSTATSTPSATTATTRSWRSITCPGVPSAPARS